MLIGFTILGPIFIYVSVILYGLTDLVGANPIVSCNAKFGVIQLILNFFNQMIIIKIRIIIIHTHTVRTFLVEIIAIIQ